MKQLSKLQVMVYDIGAIVMILALVAFSTTIKPYAPYIFGVGAASFASMQFCARYEGNNFTIRRLHRQQILGGMVLLLTTIPMWMSAYHVAPFGHNEWVLFLAVGVWLQLYTAFRIPTELKKENHDNSKR